MFGVLPYLEKIFQKNKHCFGTVLLDCLNYYLIYGKESLAQRPDSLLMFFRMADQAMFTQESNVLIHNSEGALLL